MVDTTLAQAADAKELDKVFTQANAKIAALSSEDRVEVVQQLASFIQKNSHPLKKVNEALTKISTLAVGAAYNAPAIYVASVADDFSGSNEIAGLLKLAMGTSGAFIAHIMKHHAHSELERLMSDATALAEKMGKGEPLPKEYTEAADATGKLRMGIAQHLHNTGSTKRELRRRNLDDIMMSVAIFATTLIAADATGNMIDAKYFSEHEQQPNERTMRDVEALAGLALGVVAYRGLRPVSPTDSLTKDAKEELNNAKEIARRRKAGISTDAHAYEGIPQYEKDFAPKRNMNKPRTEAQKEAAKIKQQNFVKRLKAVSALEPDKGRT